MIEQRLWSDRDLDEDHLLEATSSRRSSASSRARCLDARRPCRCSAASCCAPRGGRSSSRRPTWSSRCGRRSRRRSRATARSSCPGACSSTSRACCPTDEVDDRAPRGGGVRVEIGRGSASYRLHTYTAEDFPRLPAVDAQLHSIDREALLETVDRVARSASRDESRPVLTGILVRFEAGKLVMVATDSYRLSVKETELGETAPELEAIVPARALGRARAHRAGRRSRIELGVHENQVVFGAGRRLADDAPHRRPVPELQAAAAGAVRARAAAAARGAARRGAPRIAHGPAQLAAAAALRRGRADRLGADAGRRRGARVAARPVPGRAARDRLQPGVPARRHRLGGHRRGSVEADQPSAPRPDPAQTKTTSRT